jgi:hypothetical protein
MAEPLKLASFDDLLRSVDGLPSGASVPGPWTLPQVLTHCAQSIELSLSGFPRLRSALFHATAGRLAARTFVRRGYLHHDLQAPIPGAPALPPDLTRDAAVARLQSAVGQFRAHRGPLAPHFAYGSVSRADYEKLHAMHAADHLAAVRAPPPSR